MEKPIRNREGIVIARCFLLILRSEGAASGVMSEGQSNDKPASLNSDISLSRGSGGPQRPQGEGKVTGRGSRGLTRMLSIQLGA